MNPDDITGTPLDDDDTTVLIQDEEGNDREFDCVDVIEVDGQDYAVLVPLDAPDEEADVALIMRLETDDEGDEVLCWIDDEDEFTHVLAALEARSEEEE